MALDACGGVRELRFVFLLRERWILIGVNCGGEAQEKQAPVVDVYGFQYVSGSDSYSAFFC